MASSKPHIVLLGGDGHPSGVPRHITDLVSAFRGLARMTVISEPDKGGYAKITSLEATHLPLDCLSSSMSPLRYRQGRRALEAALAGLEADLIWSHARMPGIMLRELSAMKRLYTAPGTELALSIHGLPYGRGHRPGFSLAARRMETRLFARCAALNVVFLTEAQKARCLTALGPAMARHRTHILGNASHLGAYDGTGLARPKGRHIVMTGRAGYQKNYASALRLMRYLPPDITLSLCGAGTVKARFRQMARRLAGPAISRVNLLGVLKDVRPLLATADAYLLTSRYEGLPIGALEASEFGLPIFLADFNGADALCQDHPCAAKLTGSLSEQANTIDRELRKYLENRAGYCAKIKTHWAAHYHPDRFVEDARALLKSLLNEKSSA